ncbi:MAG: hypothetical protein M3Q69_19020, partial [Acidobacteriota bacterium]|nr:hypothetical protein [Acidobacteriota bacterium]
NRERHASRSYNRNAMPHIVVIQEIVTTWTAVSRGGSGATRRSQVPSILPLPNAHALDGVLRHVIECAEADAFAPRVIAFEHLAALPPPSRCLSFSDDASGVAVAYQWERSCGAPAREVQPPRRLFIVRPGELGRVVRNGRFAGEDRWSYEQVVTNVGLLTARDLARFAELAPATTADLRAKLR